MATEDLIASVPPLRVGGARVIAASRRRLSPGRFLAPLSLLAVGAALWLTVSSGLHHAPAVRALTTVRQADRPRPAFYVVRPGDTLLGIARRTGLGVDVIQTLNPALDPRALQVGQRLRLHGRWRPPASPSPIPKR